MCEITMSRIPNDFVDLIVTSPPYEDIALDGKVTKLREYENYDFDFKTIAKGLSRVLKPGGIIVWVVKDLIVDGSESLTSSKQKIFFNEQCGLRIHQTIIFDKHTFAFPESNRYHSVWEYIFIFSKGKPKTFNPIKDRKNRWNGPFSKTYKARVKDGSHILRKAKDLKPYGMRFNIWRYSVGKGFMSKDEVAHNHPAIFPDKLAYDNIISWSNKNDLIYDPLSGSGTTCVQSKKLGRNYIGSEISKNYCKIGEQRLKSTLVDLF